MNEALVSSPQLVNEDPFNNWIIEIELTNPSEADSLLDVTAYEQTL